MYLLYTGLFRVHKMLNVQTNDSFFIAESPLIHRCRVCSCFIDWIHGSIILFHRYARFNWNAVQTAAGTSRGSNIYRCASRVKYPQALSDSCKHHSFSYSWHYHSSLLLCINIGEQDHQRFQRKNIINKF